MYGPLWPLGRLRSHIHNSRRTLRLPDGLPSRGPSGASRRASVTSDAQSATAASPERASVTHQLAIDRREFVAQLVNILLILEVGKPQVLPHLLGRVGQVVDLGVGVEAEQLRGVLLRHGLDELDVVRVLRLVFRACVRQPSGCLFSVRFLAPPSGGIFSASVPPGVSVPAGAPQ